MFQDRGIPGGLRNTTAFTVLEQQGTPLEAQRHSNISDQIYPQLAIIRFSARVLAEDR